MILTHLKKMETRLPIEIIAMVAKYASIDALAHLSVVSRSVYFISMPRLYASVPDMDIPRTIRCLRTLSAKPEAARLVHSFAFNLRIFYALQALYVLLNRSLCNMTGLRTLSLRLKTPMPSVLSQMSCRLTKFTFRATSNDLSQISQFLMTQSTIEELSITSPLRRIPGLDPDALPALKQLTAPAWLLHDLLLPRLLRLSRLRVTRIRTDTERFVELAKVFKKAKHPRSLALMIEADLTHLMAAPTVSLGLALVGQAAPFITSLALDIHHGGTRVERKELQNMVSFALPWFPSLTTLVILAPPLSLNAYTHDNPPTRRMRVPLGKISLLDRELSSASGVPVDRLMLFVGPPDEPGQEQIYPIPDVLYNKTCQMHLLKAWHRIHRGLERVAFPRNGYTYMEKKQ
ncbi:unnamed protein product [Rhizoctonia solani]|nr:unnamed protein product [Rhizoctonia solani]